MNVVRACVPARRPGGPARGNTRGRAAWIAAGLVMLAACRGGERGASARSEADPAPPLRLAMPGGGVFDLQAQRDTTVVLFFGYTHCPDVCPTTLADFASVRRRLGARAGRVKFVFVTVDPARDTPERAQDWARGFDSTFIGLSGDSAALAAIEAGFHVASIIARDAVHGLTVSHSTTVFVVGPGGLLRERVSLTPARRDDLYAAILRALAG